MDKRTDQYNYLLLFQFLDDKKFNDRFKLFFCRKSTRIYDEKEA